MEASSSFLMTLGGACLLVSWVLLMITSWRAEYTWGMVTLLLPPISYGYALFRLEQAGSSVAFAAVGWLLMWLGW